MNVAMMRPRDFWDIAVRRKWLIVGVVGLSVSIAVALCVFLPKSYRSKTTILVETQRIPERYVSPVVGGTVSDRISMVQQSVLSRTSLGLAAERFGLYPPGATTAQKDSVVEGLRQSIKIETKGARADARVESFSISFAHADPVLARDVTAMLADEIIAQNIKTREMLVEGTTKFLDDEMRKATESLEQQEQAIAIFKKRHIGELPGQVEANLQTLNRLQRDVAATTETLQERNERRLALQKMISSYEAIGMSVSDQSGGGRARDGNGGIAVVAPNTAPRNVGAAADPLATRLRELERQLATLTAEYKDTYPDVIQVKQEIAQLNSRIAERQASAVREVREEPPPEKVKPKRLPSGIMDPYVHDLKRELDENEIGIIALKEQQRRLVAQISEYERRVEKAPEREQELLVLQRDYQNSRRNYESLLEKQLNARISENLEKRQAGETFRILDPAETPTNPESPDVMKIMLGGLLLGCGLGYGTAIGLELMAGVIRRPEEAEMLLGLPVLASIPHLQTAYESDQGLIRNLSVASSSNGSQEHAKGNGKGERLYLPGKADPSSTVEAGRRLPWKKSIGRQTGERWPELNLVAKWRPNSVVAEQFRVAATRMVLSGGTHKSMVVVVTSTVVGEGKSTTASNLAYVLGNDLGKSTLLIDCDFKRPTIHEYCGISSKPGLAEVIYGDVAVADCLHQSGDSSMWVLPSGRRDHRLVDLTKIPQISGIVADLRNRFQFIVIDAPPILPLADMNLLAGLADMILLVVRAGVTQQELMQKAMKNLKPESRAGIILVDSEVVGEKYMREYYLPARKISQ
jgi:polysaccharide chain length determinant protein (PEP-CTERM system associated)